MVELLAPAGQIESGYAAFAYGADAVYLGLSRFSARAEAQNFMPEEFDRFVRYAHQNLKKVLVAVNTVFFENEKDDLIETLQLINDVKADGVIVQDLGTAYLMKKYFPALRLHASTQMAVHNREGVETLRDLGFKRVVLARELTLDEITEICRVPNVEKEVFIHGALCYSYSGLCLFSSLYASRSANRGKCVYPCREVFEIAGEKKHVFSMKDMAQNENVLLLEKAGVSALKIEGRKKSPLYVAAVTDFYRSVLNNENNKKELTEKQNRIKCIFSRPTTELYLKNRRNFQVIDPDIVGHRGLLSGKIEKIATHGKLKYICFKTAAEIERFDGIQIDLPETERPFGFSAEMILLNGKSVFETPAGKFVEIAVPKNAPFIPVGALVYLASSGAVKRAYPYSKPKETDSFVGKITVDVLIDTNRVRAQSEEITVETQGCFSRAKSFQTAQNAVQEAFAKTGGTGLVPEKVNIDNPEKLFVPASVLNELRRNLYEQVCAVLKKNKLDQKRKEKEKILMSEKFPLTNPQNAPLSFGVKTDDPALALALWQNKAPIDEIIFELSADTDLSVFEKVPKEKFRFALPAVARAWEIQKLKEIVKNLINNGYDLFEIAHLWALNCFKEKKVDLSFDWTIYVANSFAASAVLQMNASRFVISPETPNPTDLFKAFPNQAIGLIYQDPPLFVSETCPYAALKGKCQNCGKNRQEIISSRYGDFLSVMKNCRHFLLAKKPDVKKKEMSIAGAHNMRIEFMRRSVNPNQRMNILLELIKK